MRGITEERLRELVPLDASEHKLLKYLIVTECADLTPWLPIDEFESEANEGWCWIVYKGRVVEAYHDHEGFYRFHRLSTNCYLRECIKAVMPFDRPAYQALPEDPH